MSRKEHHAWQRTQVRTEKNLKFSQPLYQITRDTEKYSFNHDVFSTLVYIPETQEAFFILLP